MPVCFFLKRGTLTDMQRQTQGDPEGDWKTRKIKDGEPATAQRPKELFSFLFKIYLLQGVCSLALHCWFHFIEDRAGAVSGCRKTSVSWLGRPSFLTNKVKEAVKKRSQWLVQLRAVLRTVAQDEA